MDATTVQLMALRYRPSAIRRTRHAQLRETALVRSTKLRLLGSSSLIRSPRSCRGHALSACNVTTNLCIRSMARRSGPCRQFNRLGSANREVEYASSDSAVREVSRRLCTHSDALPRPGQPPGRHKAHHGVAGLHRVLRDLRELYAA